MDDKMKIALGRKTSNIALISNISLMLLKAFAGIIFKSTAIIADAFNSGTDIFATAAVFGGLRIAYLPPDETHHYGHAKAEPIVSKIVAIIVMITGGTIGYSSITNIISGNFEVPGSLAVIIVSISILFKYMLYRYTNRMGKLIGSSSLIADSYNHRSDILASSSVLIGVMGARFGFPVLDPLAGLIVSVIILKTGVSIYMGAIEALMDTAPDRKTIDSIKSSVSNTRGVISVHEIKARKDGPKLWVDLKICVDKNITVESGHKIASDAKQNLINDIGNIQDVMVHVNPCDNLDENNLPRCNSCKLRWR